MLVIDDEVLLIRSLKRILGRDHDVTALSSAAEALELIARGEAWDVILCDLNMPDVDGLEFYERLRRSHPGLVRRLAFVTGGVFTHRMESFIRYNPVPLLHKPVPPDELRAFIEETARSGGTAGA